VNDAQSLKTTPLYDEHVALGAAFTDFGGWNMPVRYTSDLAEHAAVREAAGIFDISHMAEFFFDGPDSAAFLDHALVGVASEINHGRAKYSLIVNEQGGIIDDLIVYRFTDERFLMIANAGNHQAVWAALTERAAGFDVTLDDATSRYALIAVQGPRAVEVLKTLTNAPLDDLKYYSIFEGDFGGAHAYFARTGYTGEDGFELLVKNEDAVATWRAILSAGSSVGLIPAGYACRDTLRLEAGMPLYGNELGLHTTPFDAGFARVVRLDHDFVGSSALANKAGDTPDRKLVALVGEGRRAARAHYELFESEASQSAIGEITTGALSPTLGYPIAMAYIDSVHSELGTTVWADVRGSRQPMQISSLPFYKRAK
jgi:aminomethyltransferase